MYIQVSCVCVHATIKHKFGGVTLMLFTYLKINNWNSKTTNETIPSVTPTNNMGSLPSVR